MKENLYKKLEKYFDNKIIETPEQYYQPLGLKKTILNDKVYLHLNISNRRDGKSFTTTSILSDLMLKFNFRVLYLANDERSRISYFNQMMKVFGSKNVSYKEEFLEYRNIQRWYLNIYYKSVHIASVIDYSEIEALKNESAFLSQFDILFIDEFLKSSYRYKRGEYSDLKTLYKSMNRVNEKRILSQPKILLAGNPVNFDSPILSGFDLLNILESQSINTCEEYDRGSVSIIIEKHKNENANVIEENDMFPDENEDPNTAGNFVFNNYNIEKKSPLMEKLVIDMEEFYLYVYYDFSLQKILLEIKGISSCVDFCSNMSSETLDVMYLNKKFFRETSKFEKLPIKYVNSYTKTFISSDTYIKSLKFYKIISIHKEKNKLKIIDDEKYNDKILEMRNKEYLSKQFNLEIF